MLTLGTANYPAVATRSLVGCALSALLGLGFEQLRVTAAVFAAPAAAHSRISGPQQAGPGKVSEQSSFTGR